MGALPRRARVEHRARGLQRQRRCLVVVPARPRSLPGLPLERGWARRDLRRAADPVPRVRFLERPRSDPEGTHLRPHGARGQSRRGREGVLVVPGLDAHAFVDALALRVSPARLPVHGADRGERPSRSAGTRVRAARHRRVRREPLLGRDRGLRQGGTRRHLHARPDSQRGP